MLNSNQNLSPGVTSPTDITSDQAGAISKNSIESESETEQSSQNSLAGSQESLADSKVYVDSREPSPENMEKLSDSDNLTSSSTPSDPISTKINGTIGVADDDKIEKDQNNTQEVTDSKQLLTDKENEIKDLKAKIEDLKEANIEHSQQLQGQLNTVENEKQNLETAKQKAEQEKQNLEAEKNKAEQEKQNLEAEKNKAKAQITTLNTEVEKLKKELENKGSEIQKLGEKNKELEAKNKTTEQPKQGNGAKYTATVGMGLAAGLIAFTALERTVRLEMLVMIGIAVVSALVAGGITYAALPSTQVDGAKAQEVNENGKKK